MSDDALPDEALPGDEPAPEDRAPATLPDLPEDPADALPIALSALRDVHAALAARTDDLQRLAAEFENFRKRTRRQRDEESASSSRRVVEALLPVLDTLDSALTHDPKTPGEAAMLAGMSSTRQQLLDVLAREGLEVIPAAGETFDPAFHEAVMGGGGDDLVVSAEMRRGYMLGGRVLRPAMVMVSSADDEGGED